MKNRRIHRIVALCVVALLTVACGSSSPEESNGDSSEPAASVGGSGQDGSVGDETQAVGGVFRYSVPGVAQSLDPRTANEFQQIFLEQVYEPLIRTAPDGTYEPGLATDWGLTDDGSAFMLTLREGVTFQDGEPFNAEAVVANLSAAAAEGSNLASDLGVVESVEAVDDLTVQINLDGPGGHMQGILAGYPGMMVSPAAFDTDLQTNPVGAGPFTLVDIGQTSVTFEAWDGYYAADEVTLDGLEFSTYADEAARLRALRSGQIDGAFISPSQVEEAESAGLQVDMLRQASFHGALLNTAHEALGNDAVRQALSRGIDREAISEALYDGICTPSGQPYPESYWGHNDELVDAPGASYDAEAATGLLADAGLGDGFSVTISTGSITIYQQLAQVLQEQFGQLGIEAEVNVSTTLSEERRNGDFDIIVGAFQAGRPDPTVFATNYYTPDGPLNFGGIEFEGVEDLIVESRQTTDIDERAQAVGGIVAQTLEQGPVALPICIPGSITALREGVDGVVTSVLGNRDFRRVTLPG